MESDEDPEPDPTDPPHPDPTDEPRDEAIDHADGSDDGMPRIVAPVIPKRRSKHGVGEIFKANKPPTKRRPPPAPEQSTSSAAKARRKASSSGNQTQNTPGSGASPAVFTRIEKKDVTTLSDLLDDRIVADPDENYNENERALSSFLRLHPMLSYARSAPRHSPSLPPPFAHRQQHARVSVALRRLDATSQRMLTLVGAMMDDFEIPTRELEIVSKKHDDLYLRPPRGEERPCCNGEKCVSRWIAIFRHGEDTDKAFVCREFLLPSQHAAFLQDGTLPRTTQKCLLCARYFTSYVYTLARNSPSFCPRSSIQLQAFGNVVGVDNATDAALTGVAQVAGEDGYHASKMLFVDEKWAESASSRSEIGTMLWRPMVRFHCSDYEFVADPEGGYAIVQINMGIRADFCRPSSSEGAKAAARD
jgi:hypothetical protein